MRKVKSHEVATEGKTSVQSERPKEILVIGGEGAGKTLLSRRLHESNLNFIAITPENTVPTTGTDLVDLNINGRAVTCREVGSSMSSSWGKYLFSSSYILFVIDISDPGGYPSAIIHLTELLNTLRREDEKNDSKEDDSAVADTMQIPTVLIVFNKTDLADATTHALAITIFRLSDVISLYQTPRRGIQTFSGTCMNLQLGKVLLRWIASADKAGSSVKD